MVWGFLPWTSNVFIKVCPKDQKKQSNVQILKKITIPTLQFLSFRVENLIPLVHLKS